MNHDKENLFSALEHELKTLVFLNYKFYDDTLTADLHSKKFRRPLYKQADRREKSEV